jgi:hypothetical protein
MDPKFYKDIYFWIFIFSLLFTFAGCLYFGIVGKPVEMGIIFVAGASGMAFSNIDKIQYFKIGKWMEFTMKLENEIKTIQENVYRPHVPEEVKTEVSKALAGIHASMATVTGGTFYTYPWEKEFAQGVIGEEASPTIFPDVKKNK